MIFVTSDSHFGHKKAAEGRGFQSTQEMDEQLILRWNSVVKPEDLVYHLGDFSLSSIKFIRSIVERLNGKKILIYGNHDQHTPTQYLRCFDGVCDSLSYSRFLLIHSPHDAGTLQLHSGITHVIHGHTHERLVYPGVKPDGSPGISVKYPHEANGEKPMERFINVCVELTNLTPIKLVDIFNGKYRFHP